MANKRIKGITIELQGDATPLQQALKDVDKASNKTSSELNKINRSLKFDKDNTTLLSQKFDVLQESIEHTSNRLNTLKQAQSEVERMFASGEIDARGYREFNRELEITEGKLRTFKSQANNIRARLDVQTDTKGIDKLKAKIKEIPDEAKQAAKEIGQAFGTSSAIIAGGLSALTIGMSDTNKDLSRLGSQAKSTLSSVNKIANNTKKMSDAEYEVFEKSLAEKEDALTESYDKQISLAEKSYDKQGKALDRSLNNEMKALEKNHDRKLKLIDSEFKERLKLIDEDEYRRLKAIDAQIEGIEAEQAAIDYASKLAEENAKRLELQDAVNTARTKYDKSKAVQALADFEAKILEQRAAEERKNRIDSLKDEKDSIKDSANEKRNAIKDEHELKVEQINETFNREKESLSELHTLKREQFNEQKEEYLKNVKDQYAEELKAYKEMNAEKLKLASTPVSTSNTQQNNVKVNLDVSDFKNSRVIFESVGQETDQQVEALGNLVRAGYETEKEITAISKNIAGAIQIYGDTFNAESLAESITTTTQLGEVTGQLTDLIEKNGMTVEDFNAQIQQYSTVGERANYITDLLANQGMANVYDEFVRANPEIVNAARAQVEFTDAVSQLTISLTPLITAITEVVTKFATFAGENPKIAKGIAILTGAIGSLFAVFGVLYPIISNVMKILPSLTKILPTIAKGFLMLTGPIGWVVRIVLILIGLVPLIVKNWGSIAEFFSKLWKGIVNVFKGAIQGIQTLFLGLIDFVKLPFNFMIGMLNKFIKGINNIKIPEWVAVIGGKSMNIPTIPMLAKGTDYFRGGSAIVGEEGPELVTMPTGAKVHNAKDTASMLSGGDLTLNIPLSIDGRVIANAIAKYTDRELYAMQQRNTRGY